MELSATELKLILRLRQLRKSMPEGLGLVLVDVHHHLLMPFTQIESLNGKRPALVAKQEVHATKKPSSPLYKKGAPSIQGDTP